MPSRLTVNADSQFMPDVGVFLAFIQRLQPAYVFVMDDAPDYKLSAQIHAVAPYTQIIQRQYIAVDRNNPNAGGWEGSLWKVPNGAGWMPTDTFLDAFCAPNNQQHYIHNAGNEPLPHGDDLRKCLAWFVELMHRAKARNIRLCVGNFQTVGYETNEIESGVWDEYLKTLAKYKGFHYAGWHEYALAILPNGCMGQSDNNLVTFPYGTANYPSAQAFAANPFKHAHMGRYLRFVVRAKTIGAYPFENIFSEIGWDRTIREGDLIRRIDDICGEPALGINSLGKLWKMHTPTYSADMAAWQQLRWLDEVYTDDVKALCFYDWTRQPEWAEFSIHEHQELFGYWYKYADAQRTTPPVVPPIPIPPQPPTWSQTVNDRLNAIEARIKTLENR